MFSSIKTKLRISGKLTYKISWQLILLENVVFWNGGGQPGWDEESLANVRVDIYALDFLQRREKSVELNGHGEMGTCTVSPPKFLRLPTHTSLFPFLLPLCFIPQPPGYLGPLGCLNSRTQAKGLLVLNRIQELSPFHLGTQQTSAVQVSGAESLSRILPAPPFTTARRPRNPISLLLLRAWLA